MDQHCVPSSRAPRRIRRRMPSSLPKTDYDDRENDAIVEYFGLTLGVGAPGGAGTIISEGFPAEIRGIIRDGARRGMTLEELNYLALINGLNFAKEDVLYPCILVRGNSMAITNQINGAARGVQTAQQQEANTLLLSFDRVTAEYVPSGDVYKAGLEAARGILMDDGEKEIIDDQNDIEI